ncbi:MAG: peroxiredoxin [Candidatus Manganitrophaceae bacterium]|nr:MAG: peroxiredoxin [Candidatus Manganitrophaceae bacterium]
MAKEIEIGDEAPDFVLKDQDQKEIKLSDFRGKKNVVLAFYPLDWSPICTNENKCFTNDLPKFQDKETEVFGISIDSTWSHKAWADALGLKHRLLSDMKREAVKNYGLYLEDANIGKRATVIVDKNGKVRYKKVQEILTARDNNDILKALETVKNG